VLHMELDINCTELKAPPQPDFPASQRCQHEPPDLDVCRDCSRAVFCLCSYGRELMKHRAVTEALLSGGATLVQVSALRLTVAHQQGASLLLTV
jgi:hypothetical protein